MSKFTNDKIAEFYKRVGLSKAKFFDGKNPVNLFKILKFDPQTDSNGERVKTPYEMLGVFPHFVNGEEVPIVFAIKNRVLGIGKYQGEVKNFVYKKQKEKEEKTIIQVLKERYRSAIFAGDEETADSCMETISTLSSEEAREFKDTFYNYTKFYKRMKKQLLLDLFAHFFLELVQMKSSIVKKGLIKKDKIYKSYKEKSQNQKYNQDITFNSELDIISVSSQINPINFAMQNVKKVVVEDKETNSVSEFEITNDEIKIKTNLDEVVQDNKNKNVSVADNLEVIPSVLPENQFVQEEKTSESKNLSFVDTMKSFINRRALLRKVDAIPNNIQVEDEEKTPFSKVGKSTSKEREIEI